MDIPYCRKPLYREVMRWFWLVLPVILIACGRPLTDTEKTFANHMFGESFDAQGVRVVDGALIGKATYPRRKRPRLACRERIFPEPTTPTVTVSPAALVVHNKVFYSRDWYQRNFLPRYPRVMGLVRAMVFAHELTHVWQWQNQKLTGYTPLRAAREHGVTDDPYLFDLSTSLRFINAKQLSRLRLRTAGQHRRGICLLRHAGSGRPPHQAHGTDALRDLPIG
jgi:hypothetical protein